MLIFLLVKLGNILGIVWSVFVLSIERMLSHSVVHSLLFLLFMIPIVILDGSYRDDFVLSGTETGRLQVSK